MKNHMQNIAEPHTNIATFAEATDRSRSSVSGISGAAVRASTARNSATRARPAPSGARVPGAVQPSDSLRTIPKASVARPAVTSRAPATSSRRPFPARLSRSPRAAPARTTAPTGTLISSTQRQDSASTRTPPTSPPAAPPPAPTAVQVAIARARAAPSGTAAVTRVSVEGARTAAPRPCTARASSSCQPSCARPPASEASVNRPSPTTNIRLRPYRSPARPPRSMNPAKAMA